MYGARCDHQAWVDRATHNTTQRLPGTVIEPIEEVIEAVLDHVCRRPVIEPRIEFVNDGFEPDDCK